MAAPGPGDLKTPPSRRVVKMGAAVARYLDHNIPDWIEMANGDRYEYVGICGSQQSLAKLRAGQCIMAPGMIYQKTYPI